MGTGLGVESSPVGDVESCADEHREMAQPPNELGTLLIHGRGLQDDKRGFIPLAMALFSLSLSLGEELIRRSLFFFRLFSNSGFWLWEFLISRFPFNLVIHLAFNHCRFEG